jgi:hypothetical protein
VVSGARDSAGYHGIDFRHSFLKPLYHGNTSS